MKRVFKKITNTCMYITLYENIIIFHQTKLNKNETDINKILSISFRNPHQKGFDGVRMYFI